MSICFNQVQARYYLVKFQIKLICHCDGWEHLRQPIGLLPPKGTLQEAWTVVWLAAVWSIWLWHNQKVFSTEADPQDKVLKLLKIRSFLWIIADLWPDLIPEL
ncbi:hypothetical protein SLE2022_158740 [Rubroshorea leprosula]